MPLMFCHFRFPKFDWGCVSLISGYAVGAPSSSLCLLVPIPSHAPILLRIPAPRGLDEANRLGDFFLPQIGLVRIVNKIKNSARRARGISRS